ncbi:ATP-binding cassette domain-containing protein [Streptomyces sp. NPDC005962]|uniref:ATP-binding cassette domain-containing protein n=1 Tax=Streptomyces sp. NPDC005962 TaxID=3154466 RepID=UPI0033CAA8A4
MNEGAGRRTDRQGPDRAVRLTGVTRTYGRGRGGVTALDDVTAELAYGSFTAVMGPSGSGKSTFLHCASGPYPSLPAPTLALIVGGAGALALVTGVLTTRIALRQRPATALRGGG